MSESTLTPMDAYRVMGYPRGVDAVVNGLKMRVRDHSVFKNGDTEIRDIASYVYQMMILSKSSEACFNRIFKPFFYCHKALEDYLPDLEIPMVFVYGESDWVSRAPADRLIDGGLVNGQVY